MIIQLLQTLQITLSIANGMFLDRNYNKPKIQPNKSIVNYNEEINIEYQAQQVQQNFYPYYNDSFTYSGVSYPNYPNVHTNIKGYTRNYKYNMYKSFPAMTINGNIYDQETYTIDPNNISQDQNGTAQYTFISNENADTITNYTRIAYSYEELLTYFENDQTGLVPLPVYRDSQVNMHYSMALIAMSITPYNNNINNEGTFDYLVNINYGTYIESLYPQNAELETTTYISTQEEWSNIINLQNYAQNLPYLLEQYIGANAGYAYNETRETQPLTIGTDTYINDQVELKLTPNKTNYVIIRTRIKGTYQNNYNGNGWSRDYVYYQKNNPDRAEFWIQNMHISGQMLIQEGNTEVVDIPGMMFDILGMPFTFISIAFNLTIFPGTPYQINISNLFLSLLAIAVFMWIMSKILRR